MIPMKCYENRFVCTKPGHLKWRSESHQEVIITAWPGFAAWVMGWTTAPTDLALPVLRAEADSTWTLTGLFDCLLFYSIATVFQLYHGSDVMYERWEGESPMLVVVLRHSNSISVISWHWYDMMYEMRTRKPEPTLLPSTLLPTEGIFNLPHHIL